jgi:hypothetical protein
VLLAIGLVLLLGGAGAGSWTYFHVRRDPVFCTNCHAVTPAWKDWEKSAHRSINCHTCHAGDLSSSLKQLWSYVTEGKGKAVPHGQVDQKVCEKCHFKGPRWAGVEATSGHRVHVTKASVPCVRCHARTEHVKRPPEQSCLECHRAIAITLDKMGKTHCLSCHNFLAREESLTPTTAGCLRCHAKTGTQDFERGVHNKVQCANCHHPHAPRRPGEGPVLRSDCARCHADPVAQTAKALAGVKQVAPRAAPLPAASPAVRAAPRTFASSHGECRTCHQPHGARGQARHQCLSCHSDKTPHARSVGHRDCTSCHKPHDWKHRPDTATCATCHGSTVAAVRQSVASHQSCKGCHAPHLHQTARSACKNCHGPVATAVAKEARVHAECVVCHKPHSPPTLGASACASCHGERIHGAGVHDRCTQCHTPHALGGRKARFACATCHGSQVKLTSASAPPHNQCATCHLPHTDPKKARACTDCHSRQASVEHGVHKRCNLCHAPHAVDGRKARAACTQCHARHTTLARAARGPHTQCVTCHPSHAENPAVGSKRACFTCHQVQARRAAAKGGAHADCANCHAPHGAAAAKGNAACAKCHAPVAATVAAVRAPRAHAECASCHPQHAMRPSGGNACRSCHGAQWQTLTAFVDAHPSATSGHGQCQTCHAFHGRPRARKACTSCHTRVREKANLHAVPGHGRCADCHATHNPEVSGRATCLSCHTKQREHMPTSSECKGCHQFR